jgi:hypothetical protein
MDSESFPHSGPDEDSDHLPIGTVDKILEKAPSDIVEETIDIPEWECSVKLRSFTASQSAVIRQTGVSFQGDSTNVAWAQMEIEQFMLGVVAPQFTREQVAKLHLRSGRGFNRVIQWLDEKSNIDKEALKSARDEFQGSNKSDEV